MGKAGAAHRLGVRFGDAELVAGGERGGDAALGAAEPAADVGGEALAPVGDAGGEALRRGRRDDCDVEGAAGAADPLEPGDAGEIIGPRDGHRRGRHQPGAQPHRGAGLEAGHRLGLVQVDAEAMRQSLADRAHDEADGPLGGEALDAFDGGGDLDHAVAREARRGDALGLPPDQGAAQSGGEGEDGEAPAPPRVAAQRDGAEGEAERGEQEGGPLRLVGQPEPGADAEDQADREPERELVALGLGEAFETGGQAREALQERSHPRFDPGSMTTGFPGKFADV